MPVFTYRGTNRAGTTVTGEQTAQSKTELANNLKRQQINVTKMSEKGKEFNMPTFGGGVDAKSSASVGSVIARAAPVKRAEGAFGS